MARYSAALLAAIDRSFVLCEMDLPSGTTLRMTNKDGGFQSITRGFYEPRLKGLPSGWGEGLGDTNNAMQIPLMSLVLNDADWMFRNLVGVGVALDNIAVRLYRAGTVEDVPTVAEWCQYYTGVLDDYEEGDEDTWTVRLRPDDGPLRSPILTRRASLFDFPLLPKANEGQYLPLIVGKHSYEGSYNVETGGALDTFSIDDTAFKRYVGLGYVNVLRVFVGATVLTLTTHYAVLYPLINGVRHTIIDLVNNPLTNAVTVDVEGQYSLGTGSGLPVMAAIEATRLVLNQWVLPATPWVDGAWFAESARMHTASWDATATPLATLAGGAAYVAAIYINDGRTGQQFIDQQCLALGIHVFWRGDGTLAAFYDNPNALPVITDVIKESDCIAAGFKVTASKDALICESNGKWGLGKYDLAVSNPLAQSDQTEAIDLTGGCNTWP
jgi:hypothetical protein